MKFTSVALTLLGLASAQAATISWTSTPYTVNGSVGQYLDTGLFVTTGTEILAENTGGAALAFDGIDFAAGTISLGSPHAGFHASTARLAADGSYGGGGASTVSLNVEDGKDYRIQLLVADGRGTHTISGRTIEVDGVNQGTYANGVTSVTWGPALLVTGTFTANAATQDFTLEAFFGTDSQSGQLNAILVHQVPEPSTAPLLGGLGLLAFLLRRRDRH